MADYPDPSSESACLQRRAARVLPGGNSRTTISLSPYALYAARGCGCHVTDADGIERLDFLNNYTALIHGHAHAATMAAVRAQLEKGVSFAMPTVPEIELAELLVDRIPSAERIRFTNSGSEAVMNALKAARAFTGRPAIAKCEGAYHGSYDFAEVSLDSSPTNWGPNDEPGAVAYSQGTPRSVLDSVVPIPFNDTATAERLLVRHASELAAILVDPMPMRAGLIPASSEFLSMLRRVTTAHGIVLVFDEVISFRLGYAGAQSEFGVLPDLTTLGKIIGGGFPVGAVAGRADVMSVFDPSLSGTGKPALPHGGTFNANPVTMVAGRAAMEAMTPETYGRLDRLGAQARSELVGVLRDEGLPGQVTGRGSLFMVHLRGAALSPDATYRDAFRGAQEQSLMAQLHRALLNAGVIMGPNGLGCLSSAMSEADVDALASAFRVALRSVAQKGAMERPALRS